PKLTPPPARLSKRKRRPNATVGRPRPASARLRGSAPARRCGRADYFTVRTAVGAPSVTFPVRRLFWYEKMPPLGPECFTGHEPTHHLPVPVAQGGPPIFFDEGVLRVIHRQEARDCRRRHQLGGTAPALVPPDRKPPPPPPPRP